MASMQNTIGTSFSAATPVQGTLNDRLRQQAEELESVFLNTLVSEMFSSVNSQNESGGGYAEETWQSMQSEQFAAAMAKSGGIGIADQIMSNLLSAQESANKLSTYRDAFNQAAAIYAQGNTSR
jgi:peptidoglycan hydrolase FlgJ